MITSVELRHKRNKLIHDLRGLVNRAEDDDRDLNTEESSEYDKLQAAIDDLDKRISRLETVEQAEDDQDAPADKGDERDDDEEMTNGKRSLQRREVWTPAETRGSALGSKEYRSGFKRWLVNGEHTPQFRDAVLGAIGSDTTGGFFALPTKLSSQMIIAVNNLTFYRDLCTIEEVTEAKSLGVRQMTVQPSDASWSGEITQVSKDTAMTVARRDLMPQILTKLVNISIRLLQAAPDAETIVMDRLAYKIAIASENGFLNGSGSGQPLGVFTASADGVPTSQDVASSVALADLFTADDLIGVLYSIPQQYQNSDKFAWIMHRSVVQQVRTLKDGFGQYLLQTGIAANRPDLLLGFPLKQSEYAPTVAGGPTASQYVAVLGDFRFYTWAEVIPPAVQRLVERFADYNEIGYLMRYFADGSPTLPNAFARLQLAAE